ncbi:YoaK family protein [Hyalangium sp.]|uniref:YoaK family protein n=1 Tax=Hyalangium sp. TaxID=2028555 RepID=UPI002D5F1AFD|nr:YoaK family protein [Hyalangium sp.]HYH95951.1 YoaK family protein [Hyalangium sp.]
MPFTSTETSPASRRAYSVLVLLLAGVAGAVNAISFFALGTHTSHMTGNLANVGEYLANGRWAMASTAGQLVLSFLLGAITATVLIDVSRRRRRGRHATALLVEALTLAAVGLWSSKHPAASEPTVLWGMAYAMGLQNALVTRVSGAVVRTTHITGVITDIGIQLVNMMTWVRDGARGHGLGGLLWMIRKLPTAEQFWRTRLHLGLAMAFLAGCTGGPLLYFHFGPAAMALPCTVLALLVVLDVSPAGAYAPLTPGV